mgnify:CR=1 FL=1
MRRLSLVGDDAEVTTGMRDRIRMSADELAEFLRAEQTMTVATMGPRGRPHLMPVHYYIDAGGSAVTWTYAKSQKAVNLERDPRATLQVEAGDAYAELRGAMLEANVEIVRDLDAVAEIGLPVAASYLRPTAPLAGFYRRGAAEFAHILETFPLIPRAERDEAMRMFVEEASRQGGHR